MNVGVFELVLEKLHFVESCLSARAVLRLSTLNYAIDMSSPSK